MQLSSCYQLFLDNAGNDNNVIPKEINVWTRIHIGGCGTIEQNGQLRTYFNIKFRIIDGVYKDHVIHQTYYLNQLQKPYYNPDSHHEWSNTVVCAIIQSINQVLNSDDTLAIEQLLASRQLQHYNDIVCMVKIELSDGFDEIMSDRVTVSILS